MRKGNPAMHTLFTNTAYMTASAQAACAPFSCADNGANSMMIMIMMDTILMVSIIISVLPVPVQLLLRCRERRTMTNRQCA